MSLIENLAQVGKSFQALRGGQFSRGVDALKPRKLRWLTSATEWPDFTMGGMCSGVCRGFPSRRDDGAVESDEAWSTKTLNRSRYLACFSGERGVIAESIR